MHNLNSKGIIHLLFLLLLATSGIIIYLFITNVLNFNGGVFSKLYPKSQSFAQETIKVTTVDEMATFYGTYQSHNQKVVKNQYGIFMTHLHKTAYKDGAGGNDEISIWRLARSTDRGTTFNTIYESIGGTRAPAIETDSSGNIYLIHPNWFGSSGKSCTDSCPACAHKDTCSEITYDACEDNLGRQSTNPDFCKGGATGFRCYASDNLNCQSNPPGSFDYSCSICSLTASTGATTPVGMKNYFYSFLAANDFKNPQITQFPTLGSHLSAKYAMEIDEARSQLYYYTHDDSFTIIGLDGVIKRQYKLTQPGSSAHMHYPHLYLDENGYLYAAWTTVDNATGKIYRSIHFILSKDGGLNWEKPSGQKLTLPVKADETGPTDRITLDDEFNVKTWLSTFLVKNNKAHFMYYAYTDPGRQHYVRYDLATSKIDLNIYPEFKGETISLLGEDGICTTARLINQIYCINKAKGTDKIAILRSDDNGSTWHDHAISPDPDLAGYTLYSVGGSSQITDDGYIIGSYTEGKDWQTQPNNFKKVKLFSVAALPSASVNYNLMAGVNVVGIPLDVNISPSQIVAATANSCLGILGIKGLNAAGELELELYLDPSIGGVNTLPAVLGGKGYYLFCFQDTTLTISGNNFSSYPSYPPTLSLIGIPLSKNNITAENFLIETSLEQPTIFCPAVVKYDKAGENWTTVHFIGDTANNFNMDAKEGYLLFCQSRTAALDTQTNVLSAQTKPYKLTPEQKRSIQNQLNQKLKSLKQKTEEMKAKIKVKKNR